MAQILEKTKIKEIVAHLQQLQSDFKHDDWFGYADAKPLLSMDVNDADIVISFDLNDDACITVVFDTAYDDDTLVSVSVDYVESDSYEHGTHEIDGDYDALVLEGKRIIHDAAHYKLLDEDSAIETSFYDDVYA